MIEVEQRPQAYTLEFDLKPDLSPLFIKRQLETHIGERFNVLLSRTRYEIREGKIFGEGENEPFVNSLIRGRDYRRVHGNPIDRDREQAEVVGFEKTETITTDPQTPEDTKIISFSQRGEEGSAYQHNFYDIFTKRVDERGAYIETRRYSSALSLQDCAKFYLEMGFEGVGEVGNDVFFLSNPIVIDDPRFKTADDIHSYLHRDHEFMPVEEFERILSRAEPKILKYAYNRTRYNLNDALNTADVEAGILKIDVQDIALGLIPVRQVMTGCGASCGVKSVSEFGIKVRNYKFETEGTCRTCGKLRMCGPVGICEKCNDKIDSGELVL